MNESTTSAAPRQAFPHASTMELRALVRFACLLHAEAKPTELVAPGRNWLLPDESPRLLRLDEREPERFMTEGYPFMADALDPESQIYRRETAFPRERR